MLIAVGARAIKRRRGNALVAEIQILQGLVDLEAAHQSDRRLQIITLLAGHAQLVTLDRDLDLELAVLDLADQLPGEIGVHTSPQHDRLTLPVAGWEGGALKNMILPVIVLALPQIAIIARLVRGSTIEVLHSNYIRTARAKGLPSHLIVWRHVLRAALMPLVSYLGPALAGLLTGSLVVEQIFGIPGIGRYFVQGAINRDYTLVMGVLIYYAAFIILLNLLADILYAVLDPRVRLR